MTTVDLGLVYFNGDVSPLHVPWWRAVQTIQPFLQCCQDLWILHHLHSELTSWGKTHKPQKNYSQKRIMDAIIAIEKHLKKRFFLLFVDNSCVQVWWHKCLFLVKLIYLGSVLPDVHRFITAAIFKGSTYYIENIHLYCDFMALFKYGGRVQQSLTYPEWLNLVSYTI